MVRTIYHAIEWLALLFFYAVFRLVRKEPSQELKKTYLQFLKFGLVGVSNTVCNYLVYVVSMVCLQWMHCPKTIDYLLANVVAFLLSVLWAFYWNQRYVFQKEDGTERNMLRTLLRTYISYGLTGIVINNALLYLWIDIIGIHALLAPIINIVVDVPLNFILNKFWAYEA